MFRVIATIRPVFVLMAFLAFLIGIPWNHVSAALVNTESCKESLDAAQVRNHFESLFAREEVRLALIQHGVNPDEVKLRLDSLTDDEILWVSQHIGNLPAGAYSGMGPPLWVVLVALLGVVLVVALLIALGIWAGISIDEKQKAERAASPATAPWTGKWRVQGSLYASGLWALKQSGLMVESTDASYYSIKGTVTENRLEGTYTQNPNYKFRIAISPDGEYFEGHATDKEGTRAIQGVRIK